MAKKKQDRSNKFHSDMDEGGIEIEPPPADWDDEPTMSQVGADKLKAFRDEAAPEKPETD